MEKLKVLSLGTMVRLSQNPEEEYLVVARTISQVGGKNIVRYMLLNHPYGGDSHYPPIAAEAGEISEVLLEGYSDAKDEVYIQELLAEAEQEEKVSDSESSEVVEKVESSPIESTEVSSESHPLPEGDPFFELRSLTIS